MSHVLQAQYTEVFNIKIPLIVPHTITISGIFNFMMEKEHSSLIIFGKNIICSFSITLFFYKLNSSIILLPIFGNPTLKSLSGSVIYFSNNSVSIGSIAG